jgi:amino acid transporter
MSTSINNAARPRFTLSWRSAFVLSLGGTLLVTVSLGAMASDIGVTSIIAWSLTALAGFLTCLLLAKLATRYPWKTGGASAYIYEGFKHVSPLIGALAAWSYWVAWIPGVAVNLTLAATYLKATFFPGANIFFLTLLLFVFLYLLNYFGLPASALFSSLAALCAILPLLLIVIVACIHPNRWHLEQLTPLIHYSFSWQSLFSLWKWMFVAAWSAYGAEMIATIVRELRYPQQDGAKAIHLAAIASLLAFTLLPIILLALVGVSGLTRDPEVVFLTVAHSLFGPFGSAIISMMLIAALVLGAQIFVISSSRALYQMSLDGLIHSGYSKTNRYGVPIGSIGWDALITLTLLLIFQGDIINVVAAANVGYLIVFILLPAAYLLLQKQGARKGRSPHVLTVVAITLLIFNSMLLLLGGLQWGFMVTGIGLLLVTGYIPCYLFLHKEKYSKLKTFIVTLIPRH